MAQIKNVRFGHFISIGIIVTALITVASPEAHKGITSKYTYNDDVFPIVQLRCGRCHFEGGPTPMSLLTYRDAMPWAESIREQLTSEAMPPWYTDPLGPAFKGGHSLSTKEFDVLLTWATGGTPEGNPEKNPSPVPRTASWQSGVPDLALPMVSPHTLPAGTRQDIHSFSVKTDLDKDSWIRSIDLLPGTPSMVRSALISIRDGAVLANWLPGHDVIPAPSGTAFHLPAGATLDIKISYKKHWRDEAKDQTDLSTLGLYLTDPPLSGRSIETLALAPADNINDQRTVTLKLPASVRLLALRPQLDQVYDSITISAISPTAREIDIFRLHAARPEWNRRYWLNDPIELPKGTTIKLNITPATSTNTSQLLQQTEPLQIALEILKL